MKDKDTLLLEEVYGTMKLPSNTFMNKSKFGIRDYPSLQGFSYEEINFLKSFVEGNVELYDNPELESKLYDYFAGEMPYGTMKARTGDPDQWLHAKLESIFRNER